MAQILLKDNIPSLTIASTTSLTLANTHIGQPTRMTVGGQQYRVSSQLTLDLTTTGLNGLDTGALAADTLYYVYAVVSSNQIGLVASTSDRNTGPSGFSAWNEIGRFRTKAGAAETVSGAVANWRDGINVDPGSTAWTAFTPTFSHTAVSGVNFQWQRRGENTNLQGYYTVDTQSSTEVQVGLPNTYTIVLPSTDTHRIGQWTPDLATNSIYFALGTSGDTYINIGRVEDGGTLSGMDPVVDGAIGLVRQAINASVPIKEFQGLFTD